MENSIRNCYSEYQAISKEHTDNEDKLKRADKSEQTKYHSKSRLKLLQQKKPVDMNNVHMVQAKYDTEYNKTKILQQILK